MNAPEVDRDVVTTRLRHIDDLIAVLREVGPVDADRLERNTLMRLGIERALTQVVELAVDVLNHLLVASTGQTTRTYPEAFGAAADAGILSVALARTLESTAGMRNALVHEYVAIDLAKVADVVPLAPETFGQFIREVAAWVEAR